MESITKTITKPQFFTLSSAHPIKCDIALSCVSEDIIGVTGELLNHGSECVQGGLKISLRALFTVLYQGEQVNVYESGADLSFEQTDERITANSLLSVNYSCNDVEIAENKDNGFTISAVVVVNATYCALEEVTLLQDITGAIVKSENKKCIQFLSAVQNVSAEFEGERDFSVEISKVLCHSDSVRILQTESGIGEIIVDGEILSEFTFLTMQNEITTSSMVTAFHYEIECEEASALDIAISCATIKSANFKISEEEGNMGSKIKGEYQLILSALLFGESAVNCVIDGFSTTHELIFEKESHKMQEKVSFISHKQKCFGEGAIDLAEGEKILCSLNAKAVLLKVESGDNVKGFKIEGIVYLNLLTLLKGKHFIKQAQIPFDYLLEGSGEVIDITASVKRVIARNLEEKCLIDCEIVFGLTLKNTYLHEMVKSVEQGEERAVDESAISVLFITKGDDLWKVCKKALASESSIIESNPDITFPAEKDSAIVVYKGL